MLSAKFEAQLQALEISRVHSHHHSDIFAYWSHCVNAKDYETEEPIFIEEEEDMFTSIDMDLEMHLEAVKTATQKKTANRWSSDSDCGELSMPDLSTQTSISSSQDMCGNGSIGGGITIIGGGAAADLASREATAKRTWE